jgi:hypothetical protein
VIYRIKAALDGFLKRSTKINIKLYFIEQKLFSEISWKLFNNQIIKFNKTTKFHDSYKFYIFFYHSYHRSELKARENTSSLNAHFTTIPLSNLLKSVPPRRYIQRINEKLKEIHRSMHVKA